MAQAKLRRSARGGRLQQQMTPPPFGFNFMLIELASCAHMQAGIVNCAPRAQAQGAEARRTRRSQQVRSSMWVRKFHAPQPQILKVHALGVLGFENLVVKLDLGIELEDPPPHLGLAGTCRGGGGQLIE